MLALRSDILRKWHYLNIVNCLPAHIAAIFDVWVVEGVAIGSALSRYLSMGYKPAVDELTTSYALNPRAISTFLILTCIALNLR